MGFDCSVVMVECKRAGETSVNETARESAGATEQIEKIEIGHWNGVSGGPAPQVCVKKPFGLGTA